MCCATLYSRLAGKGLPITFYDNVHFSLIAFALIFKSPENNYIKAQGVRLLVSLDLCTKESLIAQMARSATERFQGSFPE